MPNSSQHGVCDGGCDLHIEHTPCVFRGQIRQSTVIGERHERIEIILRVVTRRFERDAEDCLLQCGRLRIAEGVFQFLNDPLFVLRLCLPQGKGLTVAVVGVFDIEHMTKMRTVAAIVNQRDAFCTAIDPAIEHSVPQFKLGTGGSVRSLRKDQHLIGKRILIEPSCRVQKPHPRFRGIG